MMDGMLERMGDISQHFPRRGFVTGSDGQHVIVFSVACFRSGNGNLHKNRRWTRRSVSRSLNVAPDNLAPS